MQLLTSADNSLEEQVRSFCSKVALGLRFSRSTPLGSIGASFLELPSSFTKQQAPPPLPPPKKKGNEAGRLILSAGNVPSNETWMAWCNRVPERTYLLDQASSIPRGL